MNRMFFNQILDQMISLKLYESITLSFINFGKDVLNSLGQSTAMVELPVVVSTHNLIMFCCKS